MTLSLSFPRCGCVRRVTDIRSQLKMNSPLDSAFWDAMIGAIGAVIGAIIGAWTAGKFLLKAQKLEANARRDSERQAQFERVKAVLQAFEVELKAFEAFILGLEQAFTNWEKEPYRKP